MNLFEFILLSALLYFPIRLIHVRYVSLRLRLKLSAMRDELRQDVIDGKTNCNTNAYDTLERLIDSAREDAGKFSAWNAIPFFIFFQYRKSIRKKPLEDLGTIINAVPVLDDRKSQYDGLIADYLFERHLVAILGFALLSIIPVAIFQNIKPRIRKWVLSSGNFQTFLPRITPLHS